LADEVLSPFHQKILKVFASLDEYYLALAFERVEHLPDRSSELKLALLQDIDMADLKAYFRNEAVSILRRKLPHPKA